MQRTTHIEAQEATMHAITATLSSGKTVLVGWHSWSQPDEQYNRLGRLTRTERREAWGLVNAMPRCA